MQRQQGIKVYMMEWNQSESIWVSDGVKWEKWEWKQKHYPDGKEILDFIHSLEHLSEVARYTEN